MPASYFLGSQFLGTSISNPHWVDEDTVNTSIAFVCPGCGDTWARIAVPGAEWWPIRQGCEKHPWHGDLGGSFLLPWRRTFRELPPEVIRYEVQLRLMQMKEKEVI